MKAKYQLVNDKGTVVDKGLTKLILTDEYKIISKDPVVWHNPSKEKTKVEWILLSTYDEKPILKLSVVPGIVVGKHSGYRFNINVDLHYAVG